MLALLRRRDFGLLWSGGLVSIAGDWILYASLPYFVYARTGSTIATAGMVVATLAPSVVLGSVSGVFVDRWDRKRVLVLGNVLQAGAVALLLLVPDGGWLGFVYLAAALQSAVAAFTNPAESALLPTLVPEEEFVTANALNALNNRIGRLAGLPLGGLLLGYLGLRGVVLADCLTFLVAAVLIAPIVTPKRERADEDGAAEEARSAAASFMHEWLDGLLLVRREWAIAVMFVVFGVMTFGGTMLDPPYPAWARDVLDQGPQVFAWLLTTHAASGVVGALLVGRFASRLPPRVLMGWGSVIAGALLVIKWNVPSVAVAFALTAVGGITAVASAVGVDTLAQQTVRDEYRGRVFGALTASGALLSLAGAATGGVLAELVGIVPALTFASVLTAFAGLVVLRAFRAPTGEIAASASPR
jgi:MFS family permease